MVLLDVNYQNETLRDGKYDVDDSFSLLTSCKSCQVINNINEKIENIAESLTSETSVLAQKNASNKKEKVSSSSYDCAICKTAISDGEKSLQFLMTLGL